MSSTKNKPLQASNGQRAQQPFEVDLPSKTVLDCTAPSHHRYIIVEAGQPSNPSRVTERAYITVIYCLFPFIICDYIWTQRGDHFLAPQRGGNRCCHNPEEIFPNPRLKSSQVRQSITHPTALLDLRVSRISQKLLCKVGRLEKKPKAFAAVNMPASWSDRTVYASVGGSPVTVCDRYHNCGNQHSLVHVITV